MATIVHFVDHHRSYSGDIVKLFSLKPVNSTYLLRACFESEIKADDSCPSNDTLQPLCFASRASRQM